MRYAKVDLTFDNYRDILSDQGFSLDVMDEVRSAILDNTSIGRFLDACRDDPFRLQQVRLALKEASPEWVYTLTSGSSIYKCRNLIARGVSMEGFVPHLASIPETHVDAYIGWVEDALVIPEDLVIEDLPEELLDASTEALQLGIHPAEMLRVSDYDEYKAHWFIKIAAQGIALSSFDGKNLRIDALEAIAELAGRPYSISIVEQTTDTTSGEAVESLAALAKSGFNFSEFASPGLFTAMQLDWIHTAFTEKLDYSKMLDSSLSNDDLRKIHNELVVSSTKRLSGRL